MRWADGVLETARWIVVHRDSTPGDHRDGPVKTLSVNWVYSDVGLLAERLRSGLQIRLAQFDSGAGLQTSSSCHAASRYRAGSPCRLLSRTQARTCRRRWWQVHGPLPVSLTVASGDRTPLGVLLLPLRPDGHVPGVKMRNRSLPRARAGRTTRPDPGYSRWPARPRPGAGRRFPRPQQ